MNDQGTQERKDSRGLIIRLLILIIYVLILIYLFYYFINWGIIPIIAFLIVLFFFLLVIGPLLFGIRKSYYSRLFHKKKRNSIDRPVHKKNTIPRPKKRRNININVPKTKYHQPIIRKCKNCKMIVPNFMEKCPQCGKWMIN